MKRILVVLVLMTMMVSCDFLLPSPAGGSQEVPVGSNYGYSNKVKSDKDGPWNYQEAIEDVVTYNIAICNYMINNYNDLTASIWNAFVGRIEDFDNYMLERWLKETDDTGYLNLLKDISDMPAHEYCNIANQVLKEYNNISVILSDYRQIKTSSKTKVWEFYEINSGIKFRFTLDEVWTCEMDDDSGSRYLRKNIN